MQNPIDVAHTKMTCDREWCINREWCISFGVHPPKGCRKLNVDTSTVWRTVQLFLNTGSVSKKEYSKDNLPRKVSESILFVILQVVLDHPRVYLKHTLSMSPVQG